MMRSYINIAILLAAMSIVGCSNFLEEKPDQRLATISTIKDMQALLDDYSTLNYGDPGMGEVYGDNFYLSDDVFNGRDEYDRNMYTYSPANIFPPGNNEWNSLYTQVNVANTVLQAVMDKAEEIPNSAELRHIIAQARFFRAKAFYHALGLWAMPYDAATAEGLPGIPLRLSANFSEASTRASVAEGYRQVLSDFKLAFLDLPKIAITPARPSKAAVYGMLSRTYLQMRSYPEAMKYADSCLQLQSQLLDYNTLNAAANFPVPRLNVEIVFEGRLQTPSHLVQARAFISPAFYQSYAANDLRRTIFFRLSSGNYLFKGSYEGGTTYFNGVTSAEMLLTRAECYIRSNQVALGLADLNQLLVKRYKTGTFVSYNGLSQTDALILIKNERRKELAFRAMRWMDIKRFNLEGDGIVLERIVGSKTYRLEPNSKANALAIPEDVIALSGMQQNPR